MKKSFLLTHLKPNSTDATKNPSKRPQSAIKTGLALPRQQKPASTSKKSITNEIDTLMARINDTNQNIKQTEKLLDIDLFLKTQKEKRLQYARQLNTEYEADKKKREQKLYKKYDREERGGKVDGQSVISGGMGKKSKVGIPLDIMKVFQFNSHKASGQGTIKTILNGHQYNFNSGNQLEGVIEEVKEEDVRRFQKLVLEDEGENRYEEVIKVAKNSVECSIFTPLKVPESELIPSSDGQNLMNALAFLTTNRQFAQNHYLQWKDRQKSYMLCKFYDYGVRRSILTIPTIQIRQFTHKLVSVGSRMHNGDIFWPGIIQKCYRLLKLPYGIDRNSMCKLTLLQTIYDVYGVDAQIIPFSNKSMIVQNWPKVLYSLLMDNCLVGFLNSSNQQNSIYLNRIYPLVSIENKTVKKKQLQFHYRLHNLWRGKVLSSQNRNYFKLLQLCQMFDRVVVVRGYPQSWRQLRIKVGFFSNGGIGNKTGNQWTKNSQYLLTIVKSMKVRVVLRRIRDRELLGKVQEIDKGGKVNKDSSSDEQMGLFGFMLFRNPDYLPAITCMKLDDLVYKAKSSDLNGASYLSQLQKGHYIIVPYCNSSSVKEYKFFYLDFFVEREDGINFGKGKFTDYSFINQEVEGKIIQQMKTEDKFEKPKVEVMTLPIKYITQKDGFQELDKEKGKKGAHNVSQIKHPKVTPQYLQSLSITLLKDVTLQNFYVSGMINTLLTNKQYLSLKPSIPNPSPKTSSHLTNPQLTQCQRQQNLKILLGYDALSQDINNGRMKQLMLDFEDQFDFADYQLGEEGLIAILEVLMERPRILRLDLRNNMLTDRAITYLCYYLEKGSRGELREIDLGRNPGVGKVGREALKGLMGRFQGLEIKGIHNLPNQNKKLTKGIEK